MDVLNDGCSPQYLPLTDRYDLCVDRELPDDEHFFRFPRTTGQEQPHYRVYAIIDKLSNTKAAGLQGFLFHVAGPGISQTLRKRCMRNIRSMEDRTVQEVKVCGEGRVIICRAEDLATPLTSPGPMMKVQGEGGGSSLESGGEGQEERRANLDGEPRGDDSGADEQLPPDAQQRRRSNPRPARSNTASGREYRRLSQYERRQEKRELKTQESLTGTGGLGMEETNAGINQFLGFVFLYLTHNRNGDLRKVVPEEVHQLPRGWSGIQLADNYLAGRTQAINFENADELGEYLDLKRSELAYLLRRHRKRVKETLDRYKKAIDNMGSNSGTGPPAGDVRTPEDKMRLAEHMVRVVKHTRKVLPKVIKRVEAECVKLEADLEEMAQRVKESDSSGSTLVALRRRLQILERWHATLFPMSCAWIKLREKQAETQTKLNELGTFAEKTAATCR
ncbi:hypothetical protein OQA88_5373 [Cercophora sp. LCS_1]